MFTLIQTAICRSTKSSSTFNLTGSAHLLVGPFQNDAEVDPDVLTSVPVLLLSGEDHVGVTKIVVKILRSVMLLL